MNLSNYFRSKIIPALREAFGEDNVIAQSVGVVNSIVGYIIRPEGEADIVFRLYEDGLGIVVKTGVLRSDVINTSTFLEDPTMIFDVIMDYVKEWTGVEQFGRLTMRAEAYEAANGTLTGVNPAEYNGLDEIAQADEYEDETTPETEVKELV